MRSFSRRAAGSRLPGGQLISSASDIAEAYASRGFAEARKIEERGQWRMLQTELLPGVSSSGA
jgi:hypothetical protein